ncbi:MAG TPA: hypothetical protein VM681_03110, partial [Candidatus Thermoplasmatota archaeon]|nr:hypothetical protein [Candidatus Thermoplasmatota archaeon]
MPTMVGLHLPAWEVTAGELSSHGVSVPRGVQAVRVAAYDEDCTTMAISAARQARGATAPMALFVAATSSISSRALSVALDTPEADVHSVNGLDATRNGDAVRGELPGRHLPGGQVEPDHRWHASHPQDVHR